MSFALYKKIIMVSSRYLGNMTNPTNSMLANCNAEPMDPLIKVEVM